jgi:tetratricopeptide (TPR) repeat protein
VPELSVYGLVLRGEELSRQCRRESVLHARRLLRQAAETDLGYGRACAALSRTYNYDWRYSWSARPERALDRALALAEEAVERDGLDARGYAELGYAHLYRKEHDAALAAYERAVELNPNDADIIAEYADALVYVGQAERAIGLFKRAMRLNPYYPDWYLWYLADAYNALRRHEDVITTVHKMRNPAEGRRMLAANYARLGMLDKARAEAQEIMRLRPGFSISTWAQRPPYKDMATLGFYLEGLRLAGLPD